VLTQYPVAQKWKPVILKVFRRLMLRRVHQAERLSEGFMGMPHSWMHPGFLGVRRTARRIQGPGVNGVRHIARPSTALDALRKRPDGTLGFETPPDLCRAATVLVLDPLEWIHRITVHISDSRRRLHDSLRPKPILPRLDTRPARLIFSAHSDLIITANSMGSWTKRRLVRACGSKQ
jgi:hypothetical protein